MLRLGGASFTHLETLDKVQRRAKRLIWDTQPGRRTSMDTLQHRQDVAGLSTLYKVQEERVSHLRQLRLPPRPAEMHTRAVSAAHSALATPRSHTSHHQRQFQQAYVRWWNEFLASDKCPDSQSVAGCGVQKMKVGVHKWLCAARDNDTGV